MKLYSSRVLNCSLACKLIWHFCMLSCKTFWGTFLILRIYKMYRVYIHFKEDNWKWREVSLFFFEYYIKIYVFTTVTPQHLRPRTTATRERATALQHLHHLPRARRGLDTSSLGQQRGRDLCCVQLQYRTIAIHTCNYGNTVFTYRPFDLLSHAVYSSCGQLWSLEETLSIWTVIEQQSWFFLVQTPSCRCHCPAEGRALLLAGPCNLVFKKVESYKWLSCENSECCRSWIYHCLV